MGITAGADGNLWFAEFNLKKIGIMTPLGGFTEITLPPSTIGPPYGMAAGFDGNVWFTRENGYGNVTRLGVLGLAGTLGGFRGVTAGADPRGPGRIMWFANATGSMIIYGTIGFADGYATPTPNSGPHGIVEGPDGNLWFTEQSASKIGRVTPGGSFMEFPTPTAASSPMGITVGPDGNLWFTEASPSGTNHIGRITTDGFIDEFPIPTPGSQPFAITAGPDGNLWFTDRSNNNIGRITPQGDVMEYPIPTANSGVFDITAGPDGHLWFTEFSANKIGRIKP
jgi:virginiamycin B lyase